MQSRRAAIASALVAAGALIGGGDFISRAEAQDSDGGGNSIPWKIDPINKRSGVTVFDAEKAGYNVAFVTYLSRFLLNFDPNCQAWWFSTRIPRDASPEEIERLRLDQFASFSASVEVGLQDYSEGKDGPRRLAEDLAQRYGRVPGSINAPVAKGDDASKAQRRLARSARRHIALLFGLLERTQPVEAITKLLASVDNGSISSIKLMNETFSGYESTNPPEVIIPPPEAGEKYVAAEGRVVLKSTGKLLRIDVVDAGKGYAAPPVITISQAGSVPAVAHAEIATRGEYKGSVESVQLVDGGSGYNDSEQIHITVSPPELDDGHVAVLSPVLDMAIDRIDIMKGGTGYAVERPLKVLIGNSEENDGLRRVGVAYAAADKSSFTAFRREADKKRIFELEEEFQTKYNLKSLAGGVSGADGDLPPLPFWNGGKSSSAELLRMLPGGIGLEYDSTLKRYVLAVDTDFLERYPAAVQQASNRPLGFEYGPRGRAPIERNMQLGLAAYLRFGLSGAICSSGVHLALTPLDVVKTKGQVDPAKYPNITSSLGTVWNEEGPSTLFTGWLPTYTGHFVAGGALYAVTEFIRRSLTEAAGADAVSLEVPIILFAALVASSLNAVLICPFDAVRIRTVAQPEYAASSVGVLTRMLEEEGFGSLVNAIPVFLARNIPYAMVKFLVFDLSTERLYQQFPAAQEDLKLSLLVSLAGGIMGGTAAAVISNPADAVISELKKARSDLSPFEAVNNMMERAGLPAFFVGLPIRMAFYSINGSMTFVVYDAVRFLLGIGSDDLKLYLDVLGGALTNNPLV